MDKALGQRFKIHLDGHFQRPNGERSMLTFMIYLNDDFKGGETEFVLHGDPSTVSIAPKTGMALFFHHRQWHEGTEIIEGAKYVLRTDVMYSLAQIL